MIKYTLVQHSGFGYADKPGFEHAVEVRSINSAAEARLVEREGGMLFDGWKEADDAEMLVNYPPDNKDVYPAAKGTFSEKRIDGLRIYRPIVSKVVLG